MRLFIFLLAFVFTNTAFAQEHRKLVSVATPGPTQPLIIVNGKIIQYEVSNLIDKQDIENIEILKDAASTAIYGVKGMHGVVIVTLKKGTEFLPYDKLLKKFKVKREHRQYVPYIDHQPIANTNEFYASPNKIKSVGLEYRHNGIRKIPYLSIVTNQ